jgi:hypothetical protein
VAASSGAPQHLGNRGPRGLLEVRGLAASGERESRLVSAPGSNWFLRPHDLSERAWRSDVTLLDQTHRSLREAVANLSSRELSRTIAGSTVSNFALLAGIAAHDLYHAGQIQLLKRLWTGR